MQRSIYQVISENNLIPEKSFNCLFFLNIQNLHGKASFQNELKHKKNGFKMLVTC